MRPRRKGFDSHQAHEAFNSLGVHMVSFQAQYVRHHPYSQSRVMEVKLVHAAHQFEVKITFAPRPVIERTAIDVEQLALPDNA